MPGGGARRRACDCCPATRALSSWALGVDHRMHNSPTTPSSGQGSGDCWQANSLSENRAELTHQAQPEPKQVAQVTMQGTQWCHRALFPVQWNTSISMTVASKAACNVLPEPCKCLIAHLSRLQMGPPTLQTCPQLLVRVGSMNPSRVMPEWVEQLSRTPSRYVVLRLIVIGPLSQTFTTLSENPLDTR
jgi:hypothetical protein